MGISLSVVVPVFNEEAAIGEVIDNIHNTFKNSKIQCEILVIDDGSTDSTGEILKTCKDKIELIRHPENVGYGRSIKDGIWKAKYPHVAIVDGDGSYPIDRLPDFMPYLEQYDMVVGARTGRDYRGSMLKYPARLLFLWLSEFASGRHIPDVNSGFRVFKKNVVMKFFNTLSPGFSFTTSITLAMALSGHFIKYVPIEYHRRKGKSKIRYIRDTMRSLQIIIETILYYNPIKLFILIVGILWLIALAAITARIFFRVEWLTTLAIGSSLASFLIFGLGLTTDLLRKISMKEDAK